MNLTHVTRVNNVERTIKSVHRTARWNEQVTTLDDDTVLMSQHARRADGTIRPIEHTAQGEISIVDEFPLSGQREDEFTLG